MENYTWYLLVRNMNNISSRRTFQLLIESAGRPRRLNSTINIIGGLADYNGDFLVLIVVINSRDVLPIHSRTGLVYKRTYPPVYDTRPILTHSVAARSKKSPKLILETKPAPVIQIQRSRLLRTGVVKMFAYIIFIRVLDT